MTNKFTFILMTYPVDPVINGLLSNAIDYGIRSISTKNEYYIDVEFGDGSVMSAWNANRYYAWLNCGTFTQANGVKYKWLESRPKRSTMNKFYKAISSHFKK